MSTTQSDVAIRPWPAPEKEKLEPVDIFAQVEQLAAERGHLRFITEDALRDEIATGTKAAEEVMEGVEEDGKESKPELSREDRELELRNAQMTMYQNIEFAQFNAANMLDLVSLVLSKDPKKNVTMSYSQMLQEQKLPPRSFGVAKVFEHKEPTERDVLEYKEQSERFAARGSRMQALESAADSILQAATQLETEIGKEVKYWDEILSISQKGWPLQKYRRNVRNSPFAVRYGHPEAGSEFKARGLAPLRMDEDGSIILDPALALKPKTLRVRVQDNVDTVGTSHLAIDVAEGELGIEKSIQLARDSQFEEELFHEISMEARQLLPYGVEMRNSVVHLAIPDPTDGSARKKILIDCVARDESVLVKSEGPEDWLAENIAEGLRLLLSHEHRMRLYRRSQIQPPVSQQKKQAQSPPLLRTTMALFSHISATNVLQDYANRTAKTLEGAGLPIKTQITREEGWEDHQKMIGDLSNPSLTAIDQLLETFLKPFQGTIKLSLPSEISGTESLTIATRTYIGLPTCGTEFKVTLPQQIASVMNLSQDQKRDFKISSADEVKSYVDWLLALDLTHNLLFKEFGKRASIRSKEPQVTVDVRDGNKISKRDIVVLLDDGKLHAVVRKTPLFIGDPGDPAVAWQGAVGEESLVERLKSLLSRT